MLPTVMFASPLIIVALCLSGSHSLPPDKDLRAFHIIKTRSIDINNAYGLAMESRLEKSVEPTGYSLDLEPYLEDGYFTGRVRINITWLQDTEEITVHSGPQLKILEQEVVVLKGGLKHSIGVRSVEIDIKKPIATVYLEKSISKSSVGYLSFTFRGEFQTGFTEAFFKSTYSVDENERMVAGTQLRPNNARRMFPCFDEPGYKTPFDLSVVRPKKMVALSNMDLTKTEEIKDEPNAVRDYFERSPPMSTYTLGLVIADLKLLDNYTKHTAIGGKTIFLRVWARPEYLETLESLNDKIFEVFCKLESIWQVPLPLSKLDIVALPTYTGVKPSDNWGLIIFKESDLNSKGYLQLAQEISYQWLGAFTTPAWWSDAHLNKALVGYIAAETAFEINHGSEMEGKWPLTVLYSLYYEFSKRYPHSRITGMKQETTCTKLELLFRMFNYTIGGNTFKKAIKNFLESRKFKTFTGDDIWSALSAAAVEDKTMPSEVDTKTVAKSWIDKDRLPVVNIDRNYEKKYLVATQKLYLRERPHDVSDAGQMSWWVPLVIIKQDNLDFTKTTPEVWTKEKELKIENMPGKDQFIIVNPEEIAPFPVNYDTHNWYMISQYLQSSKRTTIPELTRAKLQHDAWNLAFAGELSFATALNMTLFLKDERSHLVWDSMFTMIDHVGRQISPCIQDKFKKYVRLMLSPLYEELKKEEKDDEESWKTNLRTLTKNFLCQSGYKPCIKEAQELYAKWMQSKNPDEGNPKPPKSVKGSMDLWSSPNDTYAAENSEIVDVFESGINRFYVAPTEKVEFMWKRIADTVSNQYICPVFKYGTMKEWDFGLQRVINFPPSRKQSERTYLLKNLAGCPVDTTKIKKLLNITLMEGNGNFTETDLFLIFNMLTGSSEGYTTLLGYLFENFQFLKEKYGSQHNLWDSLISSASSGFKTQDGLDMVSNFYSANEGHFGSAEHIIDKSLKNIKEEAKWSSENIPVISKWLDGYIASSNVKDDKFIGVGQLSSIPCK